VIRYCSQNCQLKDWETHKKICTNVVSTLNEIMLSSQTCQYLDLKCLMEEIKDIINISIDNNEFNKIECKFEKNKMGIFQKVVNDCRGISSEKKEEFLAQLSQSEYDFRKNRLEYEEQSQMYIDRVVFGIFEKIENNLKSSHKKISNTEFTIITNMLRQGDLSDLQQIKAMDSIFSYIRWTYMKVCLESDKERGLLKVLKSLKDSKAIIKDIFIHRNENIQTLKSIEFKNTVKKISLAIDNLKPKECNVSKGSKFQSGGRESMERNDGKYKLTSEFDVSVLNIVNTIVDDCITYKHKLQMHNNKALDLIGSCKYTQAATELQLARKVSKIISAAINKKYLILETYCLLKTKDVDHIMKGFLMLLETDVSELHRTTAICYYYYALSMHYYALKDYKEAYNTVQKGMEFLRSNLECDLFFSVEQTNFIKLLCNTADIDYLLQRTLYDSRYRPKPDGICRYDDCYSCNVHEYINSERPIYQKTDIDFKGVVSLICKDKCKVDFHMVCWKELKSKTRNSEKAFIGMECMTPNCLYSVDMVKIVKFNGQTKLVI